MPWEGGARLQHKHITTTPAVQRYVIDHSMTLERRHLDLIAETEHLFGDRALLQVPPEQAMLMRMLTQITHASNALEIGTFTGLSAMFIAEGLGEAGALTCLDIDPVATAVARRHWDASGIGDRIELIVGPATDSLEELSDRRFDLVFIDADKPGYVGYFDAVLPMVESGGLIVADNTLYQGKVVDESDDHRTSVALREFNAHVARHPGVEVVMLPVFDGITLIRKR